MWLDGKQVDPRDFDGEPPGAEIKIKPARRVRVFIDGRRVRRRRWRSGARKSSPR